METVALLVPVLRPVKDVLLTVGHKQRNGRDQGRVAMRGIKEILVPWLASPLVPRHEACIMVLEYVRYRSVKCGDRF